jgi:hypothetical protein
MGGYGSPSLASSTDTEPVPTLDAGVSWCG